MQEYTWNLRKGLITGLRIHPQRTRYVESLVECFNIMPTEWGLVPYKDRIQHGLFNNPSGFLFKVPDMDILCINSEVDFYFESYIFPTIDSNYWDCVSFEKFWVLLNKGVSVYNNGPVIPGIAPDSNIDINGGPFNFPLARTGCNAKGRLFLGNIVASSSPDWFDCGKSSVVWSKIGSVDCKIDLSNESGYATYYELGEIFKVRFLDPHVIVYGSNGIGVFTPADTYFGYHLLKNFGIAGFRAIEVSPEYHLFIDKFGQMWKLTRDLKIEFLDYKTWFENCDPIMSYDQDNNWFFIYNPVTQRCFIYNGFGLSECYQLITNCIKSVYTDEINVLAFPTIDANPNQWRICSDSQDFLSRGMKTLHVVGINGNYDSPPGEPVLLQPYWRNSFNDDRENFNELPTKVLNDNGVVTYHVSGRDLRVRLIGSDFRLVHNIDNISMQMIYTDKRFQRGIAKNYE